MAGQTITLQTPLTTADTAASVVSKINTDLSAIQVELARKVTPDDMLVTTDLSMVGHYITEAGGVILEDTGLSPSTLGTVYYSGGDLWVVTSGGAVQITDSGAINVASAGGITGDYPGASGASVDYTHSTLTYAFMDSPSVWANLKGIGYYIINAGLTASTKLTANITTNATWSFCDLPVTAAGIKHLVTIDSTGALSVGDTVDAPVTLASNVAMSSTLAVTGLATLTAGFTSAADQKHTDSWSFQGSVGNVSLSGGAITSAAGNTVTTPGSVWQVLFHVQGLRAGDKITSVSLPTSKSGTGATSCTLYRQTPPGGLGSVLTGSTITSGFSTITVAIGTPVAIAAGEDWFLSVSGSQADTLYAPKFVVTHP